MVLYRCGVWTWHRVMNAQTANKRPSTFEPSRPDSATSPPIYRQLVNQTQHRHLSLLDLKADTRIQQVSRRYVYVFRLLLHSSAMPALPACQAEIFRGKSGIDVKVAHIQCPPTNFCESGRAVPPTLRSAP